MNFQDAEKIYRDLKQQHAAGKLSDADFEAEVAKLRLQDAQGRWWQLGVQTGEWYMHDGQKWNKAKPPAAPAAPAAPPPLTEAPAAATEGGAAPKPRSGSVLPARLFSAAPPGRGNGKGLPTPMLIGIIAVVAVVAIAILVGGYLIISGARGTSSTARATTTPTRALAALSTPVVPTITLARPTDTPLPPPMLVVTATETVTPTRAVAKPTATKKPAAPPTPAGPTATATLNVPPGVYATKLEATPKPNADPTNPIGFKLTLLNSTGSTQTFRKWFVRVFQCPEQCVGDSAFKNSYGESLKQDVNVPTGTVVITAAPHVNFGPGRCEYIAIPYYTDANEIATQFQKPGGGALYYDFSICQ